MPPSVATRVDWSGAPLRYEDLFRLAPIGWIVMREDSRVEDINHAAARMLGWSREWLIGQRFSRWILAEDVERFSAFLEHACRSEESRSDELQLKDRHGRARDVRLDSAAVAPRADLNRCQLNIIDINEQHLAEQETRLLQDELAHVARLNSCGEIATALAHELNQPLGAIVLYCNACLKGLGSCSEDPARLAPLLEKTCAAAQQASGVIQRLRTFLRKAESSKSPADLNRLILETLRLVSPYAKDRGSRIKTRLESGLPLIVADHVHIQQVLMNLIQNAIEAMHAMPVGRRTVLVTSEYSSAHMLSVTVSDSGPGMDASTRQRAFEPFYTSKKNGMGIGLSLSRSIIESYGGRLWAAPCADRGARLHFTLPIEGHV
jgi:two-component system sensor kinase FixL